MEFYFKRPLLWDVIICIIAIGITGLLQYKDVIQLPPNETVLSITDDIGTIGLTVSGFVITIITILLTLRSGQILSDEELKNDSPPFQIFLASPLYSRSINILKFGVFSLIVVAIASYIVKQSVPFEYQGNIHYFNIIGLVMITMIFLRSFYVLGKILKMQGNG